MNLHSFRTEIRGRRGVLYLDDVDISSAVATAHVTLNARELPRVELELIVLESTRLDLAEARVYVSPPAHDVLVRLGWTPPAEGESGHRYLSTGCLHGEHAYCAAMTGQQGQKRPATCKFCPATCICPCHAASAEAD